MSMSLVIDIVVAILLVVTIGYAVVLNRRLGILRRDKEELKKLVAGFGEATVRAEESIGKLKNTTDGLHDSIDKAQALRDDLVFLIDRGGSAADRLEEMIRSARDETGVGPRPPAAASGADDLEKAAESKSQAERELLKALQAVR